MTDCAQTQSSSSPPFSVRLAELADLPALVALERRCFAIPWSEAALLAELSGRKQSRMLVTTTADDMIIGYVGCWFVLDEGQINNIAVDPDWRRIGAASVLLQTLLSLGKLAGIRQYSLEVRQSNEAARALYREFGFIESGFRRAYYTDNEEDAIIMFKNEE